MYLMVATGYTMSFYLAQILWENAQLIALQYRDWVVWYTLITALISFVICYRFGPITNTRTKKIIQWFLQVIIFLISNLFSSDLKTLQRLLFIFQNRRLFNFSIQK